MEVTPQIPEGRQIIQAYGTGGFRISNERREGAILIALETTLSWQVDNFESISVASIEPILEQAAVEILLIGTGEKHLMMPVALRKEFSERGISIETMATPAACRTYNVLMAEERRVAAALLPVD